MYEMSVPISFRISDELGERLEKISIEHHKQVGGRFNRSHCLTMAIEEFCDRWESNKCTENNLLEIVENLVKMRITEFELRIDDRIKELIKREIEPKKYSVNTVTQEAVKVEDSDPNLWTDAEVAKEENKKPGTVSKYRTGQSKPPKGFDKRWKVSSVNSKRWESVK